MKKDLYKVLGITPKASAQQIRARYRALVTNCHPDKFLEAREKERAEERIKKINQAYETLGDPQRRAAYDRQCGIRSTRHGAEVRPRPPHPTPVPTAGYGVPSAPVTPVASPRSRAEAFTAIPVTPHFHQEFYGQRGEILRVWLDRRANILLLSAGDYARYLRGGGFHYLGGYARQSPVDLLIPQEGWWHLVVDLRGEAGEIRAQARILSTVLW